MPKVRLPTRTIPTREKLDAPPNPKRRFAALGILGGVLALAVTWWNANGADIAHELLHQLNTFRVYWSLATDAEKTTWKLIAFAILLAIVLAIVLLHRIVWRAFFPDLRRFDARMHRGGTSERVGRLYRIRAFQDGDKTWYRHYYKHGNRWLPLFRFDHVDLQKPAEHVLHGVALIRCGRLERDADGNRFKHIPNAAPYGAAPLTTRFREDEVQDDQYRKTSIVGPGASMNPEVMRKKWRDEAMINPWPEKRARQAIDPTRGPPEES